MRKDCQDALTKQITGFANSDGGSLIIGVEEGRGEQKHLAIGFAPCDGVEWTKERLEMLIDSNISPRVSGIAIHPVRLENDVKRSIYVIEVPKGETCHQSSDGRYYFRLNFSTEVMKDFQIRDVMNRKKTTEMRLFVSRYDNKLDIYLRNSGSIACNFWTLEIIIPEDVLQISRRGDGTMRVYGLDYKYVTEVNIDFEELSSTFTDRFSSSSMHCIEQNRAKRDNPDVILPRSALKLGQIVASSISLERLVMYWQIDSDDGNRTYGILTPDGTEWRRRQRIAIGGPDYVDVRLT